MVLVLNLSQFVLLALFVFALQPLIQRVEPVPNPPGILVPISPPPAPPRPVPHLDEDIPLMMVSGVVRPSIWLYADDFVLRGGTAPPRYSRLEVVEDNILDMPELEFVD